jgi:hypothetical protein
MQAQKSGQTLLLASAVAFFAMPSLLHAENPNQSNEPPAIQVSQEVIADFARMFKVSPDNPELQETFRQLNESLRQSAAGAEPENKSRTYNPNSGLQRDRQSLGLQMARTVVARHYRFESGIPFQEAPREMLGPEEQASTKGAVSYFQGQMRASVNAAKNTPPLPRCSENAVDHSKVDSGDQEFDKERVSDFLFLRGAEPTNSAALFGQAVTVISCGAQSGDRCALSAGLLNLRCLPTRLRMSKGKATRIEGKNALANFDQGGAGKLMPEVAAQLEVFMGEVVK